MCDNIIQFKLPEISKLDIEIMTNSIMHLVTERLHSIKMDQRTSDKNFIDKVKYEIDQLMSHIGEVSYLFKNHISKYDMILSDDNTVFSIRLYNNKGKLLDQAIGFKFN